MQQVWITRTGGPEVLELREAADPRPGPGEVCIRVEAAGVNFADLMARYGLYPDAPPLPAVVGYEVGGTVERVGADVAGFAAGDAVFAMTRFGGYSSMVCVPAGQVFRRPARMTAEEGAALPVTYLTAFQAMVLMGGLRRADERGGKRQRVLVHGASGGVGTAAADLGKLYDVELFGTASPAKHDYARARGYHHLLDYRHPGWPAALMDLTGGHGVHLALDPIGGASWTKSLACLAPTGRLVIFGFSALAGGGRLGVLRQMLRVPWLKFNPFRLMSKNQGVLGVNLGHLWHVGEDVRGWALQLLRYYEQGHLRPHVGKVFPLAEAAAAHRYIEDRKNTGKVLLKP